MNDTLTRANDEDQLYQVALDQFEGPLDLLLHLVKRHELSILDIPIAFVTEKYIEYLEMMQALNLEVAGDYLVMAATLAHIKSRELLPKSPLDEEDDEFEDDMGDPRQELIRRLLEFQRYKEVAEHLGDRPILGRTVFARGAEQEKIPNKERPFAEVGTFELLAALADVLERSKVKLSYEVTVDRISISDRINHLVDTMRSMETVRFFECFKFEGTFQQVRHEVVVTFLAMLEMGRLGMIKILQHVSNGEIYITRTESLHEIESFDGEYL